MDWIKIFEAYGLAGLVIGALFFMAWRREVWLMAWAKDKDLISDRKDENNRIVLDGFLKAIESHNIMSAEFRRSVEEAHKYQREEHLKLASLQDDTCRSMKEVKDALGRINGYKHE